MFEEAEFRWKGKNDTTVHLLVYGWSLDENKYLQLSAEQAKKIGYELMQFNHYRAWVTDGQDNIVYSTEVKPKMDSIFDYEVTMQNVGPWIERNEAIRAEIRKAESEFKHQKALARRRYLRHLKKQKGDI